MAEITLGNERTSKTSGVKPFRRNEGTVEGRPRNVWLANSPPTVEEGGVLVVRMDDSGRQIGGPPRRPNVAATLGHHVPIQGSGKVEHENQAKRTMLGGCAATRHVHRAGRRDCGASSLSSDDGPACQSRSPSGASECPHSPADERRHRPSRGEYTRRQAGRKLACGQQATNGSATINGHP